MTANNNPDDTLPPSLAVEPNIPWEAQTLEQLRAERDYWLRQSETAPGLASWAAARNFLRACEVWIAKRESEARVSMGVVVALAAGFTVNMLALYPLLRG